MKASPALRPGNRVRLIRPFRNGNGEEFSVGMLGVVRARSKIPPLLPPDLIPIRLDGVRHDIILFKWFVELV